MDDDQEIPGFVQDNSDVFGSAPPRWEDVKGHFAEAFPDLPASEVKQAYTQAWNLGAARHLAAYSQENAGTAFERHWLPLAGTVMETGIPGGSALGLETRGLAQRYYDATQRFQAGNPTDDDYQQIAFHEARQERDAAQPWWEQAAQGAVKTGGEMVLTGGLMPSWLRPAAGASLGTRAALGATRAGVQTLATPSLGATNVIEANREAGRAPLDPQGLPAGLARGFAQAAVFEAAGGASGKALGLEGQAGLKAALGRTALAGVEAPFLQMGADLVSYSAGLQTGYGTIEELSKGKLGEAGKGVASQALTAALLHGVHEGQGLALAKARLKETADAFKGQAAKGYGLPAAAEAVLKAPAEEAPAQQPQAPEGTQAPGTVRFYHGGLVKPGEPRWLTPDRAYAEGYAAKSGAPVHYVDLPEGHPLLEKAFDDSGTNMRAPYLNFEAPPEIAAGLRPLPRQLESQSAPAPAAESPAEPQPAAPAADVETMRAALQAVGLSAKKWDTAKVLAEAQRLGLDQAQETTKPPEPQTPATYAEPPGVSAVSTPPAEEPPAPAPEEALRQKLTRSKQFPDVGNTAAFHEAGPSPVVAVTDVDQMHRFEGKPEGTAVLRAKIDALRAAGLEPYHAGQDEFLVRGPSAADLTERLDKARELLGQSHGTDFSYGVGADPAAADESLRQQKMAKAEARHRAGQQTHLEELIDAAGLSGREQHLVRQRLLGRTLEDIADDEPMRKKDGNPYTRERVRQLEKKALGKLGVPAGTSLADLLAQGGAEEGPGQAKPLGGGASLTAQNIKEDAALAAAQRRAKAPLSRGEQIQKDLEAHTTAWMKEVEDAGESGLSPERLAHYEAETGRLERAFAESARGGPSARRQPAEPGGPGPVEPAPARREPGTELPDRGANDGPAAAGEGPARAAPEAAGSQLKAGGEVAPDPYFVKNKKAFAAGRGYERQAREAGVDPTELHSAAAEIRAGDRDYVEEKTAFLKEARDALREFGGHGKLLHLDRYEDSASVPGIDEVAGDLSKRYPSYFNDRENASDTLFHLLKEGNPEPVSEDEAYRKALDYLTSRGPSPAEDAPFDFGAPLADAERQAVPGGGQPGAGEKPPQWTTALANARIDQERQANQLPPLLAAARRTNPEVWDRAMARLTQDPEAGQRLVDELSSSPRATTVDENALLLQRQIALRNEHTRAMLQFIESRRPGAQADAVTQQALLNREEQLLAEVDRADRVARSTGTEWGRAGQFRRQLAAEDYSLSGMLLQAQAARPDQPLSPQEKEQILAQQQQIDALQKQLDAAQAAYRPPQGKPTAAQILEGAKPVQGAQTQLEGARGQWRRTLQDFKSQTLTPVQQLGDLWLRIRRAELLSSPATLAKITAAAAERAVLTPLEEAAGSLWARIPGIAKIAAMAPRQGRGLNLAAEKAAFADAFGKGMRDSWETIQSWKAGAGGKSELDLLYGRRSPGGGPEHSGWLEFPGVLHAALKAPIKRAEYTRSMLQRIDHALANGQDATSPGALSRMGLEAYQDAQRAVFMQDNAVVDAYRGAVRRLKASGPAGRVAAVAADTVAPIVRVPTNLVGEVIEHVAGVPIALTKILSKGAEGLKPAEADVVMRQLKKGSLGLAVLALGMLNPKGVGGLYQEDEKRKPGDVKAGGVRTPAGDVPGLLQHHPLLQTMQVGATFRRALDQEYRKQGMAAAPLAAVDSAVSLGRETPFLREPAELAKLADAKERGYAFGQFAKSLAVPALFDWLAKGLDVKPGQTPFAAEPVKRSPKTIPQHLETGVPGLRQQVPQGR